MCKKTPFRLPFPYFSILTEILDFGGTSEGCYPQTEYGLELMMALFNIVQGLISTIMTAAGFGAAGQTVLPSEIVTAVEDCGFFESIPLWAVTLIGGLFITV